MSQRELQSQLVREFVGRGPSNSNRHPRRVLPREERERKSLRASAVKKRRRDKREGARKKAERVSVDRQSSLRVQEQVYIYYPNRPFSKPDHTLLNYANKNTHKVPKRETVQSHFLFFPFLLVVMVSPLHDRCNAIDLIVCSTESRARLMDIAAFFVQADLFIHCCVDL